MKYLYEVMSIDFNPIAYIGTNESSYIDSMAIGNRHSKSPMNCDQRHS
jgi:hypothetical protein